MEALVNIEKPFSEKYTLFIDTDMKAVNVNMQSKVKLRWNLRVVQVDSKQIEIELIRLDNVLLETSNPLAKEVQQMSDVFGKMYNELHLILDKSGSIIKVLNVDIIKDKWATIKQELEAHIKATPEIQDAIHLNDDMFAHEEKIIHGIQSSEFFMLYFQNLYGNYFPYNSKKEKKYNFFNTAELMWGFTGSIVAETNQTREVTMEGSPYFGLADFSKKAYAQFSNQLPVAKLIPKLKDSSHYLLDKNTGRVLEAKRQKHEIADIDNLYFKIEYTFLCEDKFRDRLKEHNAEYR